MGSDFGSIIDTLSAGEGTGGSGSGENITDTIAEAIGDAVAALFKQVLGNLS